MVIIQSKKFPLFQLSITKVKYIIKYKSTVPNTQGLHLNNG